MTKLKPSESLDKWRDYFRRGDSDIYGIIDHAIMVAATDCPKEFKSKRDRIAELLYSCKMSHCIGCDHHELSIAAGDKEVNNVPRTVETVGVGGDGDREDETKPNKNQIAIVSNHSYGEAEALSDQLGEDASVTVDEIMRIKVILLNKDNEPNSVLLESLRKLESIPMTVDILKDTEIGKVVTRLRRHRADKISKLAKILFVEWKNLVDLWMNTPKEMARVEETPQSANISIVDQLEAFPSPPYDLDIFAPPSNEFDISKILDCMDSDGNPRDNAETRHERRLQSSVRRRPEGTNEANVVERYNKDQKMRRVEADDVRPKKHSATGFYEPRRQQPKQSREQMVATREQMVPTIQRKPLVVAEQKRKLAGPQQDKLKAMDPEARFESAKRKLQESYRHHENARRKRKIQVLETIPKKSKAQKPQLKRTVRR
ncbi:putative mediator of RNA polymerase II transcription subunit 26a [Cardamine amara subsp. amara]|uniref:Mediator of RNA polymerase II transcription subunit 26a n=1 Tax=Cardamine amara subsp. amara TaxID=228776 RepID=A0ABD0YZJ2_CARAN